MAKRFYFIDDSVTAGQNTVASIENESATFGIGATTALEPDNLGVGNSLTVGVGVTVQGGIVTATGGFTSGISTFNQLGVSTTPIHITLEGNVLSFTAVGIGSTFLTLALS